MILSHNSGGATSTSRLPIELWEKVVWELSVYDLICFSGVSRQCRHVAAGVLRYPHIDQYRLIRSIEEDPLQYYDVGNEKDEDEENSVKYKSLAWARFEDRESGLIVEIGATPNCQQHIALGSIVPRVPYIVHQLISNIPYFVVQA